MKIRNYLFTLTLIILFSINISDLYTQTTSPYGDPSKFALQRESKIFYAPDILPDILATTAYGEDVLYNQQWCRLTLPGAVFTNIAPLTGVYYGIEFADDVCYAFTAATPSKLYTIDINTGIATLVAQMTITDHQVTSMAWGKPNGPMYIGAPNMTLTGCNLYTINLTSGACTLVAPITNANGLMFFAINCLNECYGVDVVTNNVVKINLSTGAGTVLGPCGINSNYNQCGRFDLGTNTLYWIAQSGSNQQLRTINLTTGSSTLITQLVTHEVASFGIPGSCPTGIINNRNEIPVKYKLYQNYPNPFNPSTVISYGLPKSGNVKLVVFDLLGREVKMLVNEFKTAGNYDVSFNASELSSGLYFYRIEAGNFTDTKKMILIK